MELNKRKWSWEFVGLNSKGLETDTSMLKLVEIFRYNGLTVMGILLKLLQ
jgi:hypothetical protein